MEFKFDRIKLQKAIDDFYYATGIGITLMKSDFSNLHIASMTNKPYCDAIRCFKSVKSKCITFDKSLLQKCRDSRKAEIAVCHGGLVSVAIPFISQKVIVAYAMLYGFRQENFSHISKDISVLPIDHTQLDDYYQMIPKCDDRKIESMMSMAIMFVNYVISEGIITLNLCSDLERVKEYIDHNLDQDLSISVITRNTNICKSSLYKSFRQTLDCTVNEYITAQRIKKAEELLLTTDATLDEIASATGFSSADYLGHLFKKTLGQTPTQYRKLFR